MSVKIDTGTSVSRKKVEVKLDKGNPLGNTRYDFWEGLKEIINNSLVNPMQVKLRGGKLVDVQVVVDTTNKEMTITDNMTGWDENTMMNAMDIGYSIDTPAIMSAHGYGLKALIPYFGGLKEIRSSRDGNDYFAMRPVNSNTLEHEVFEVKSPLQRYNVKTNNWNKMSGCGSMMILEIDNEHLPWTDIRTPKAIVKRLEHAYSNYIDKTIRIEFIWLRNNKVQYHTFCKKHTPLLSNERALVGKDGEPAPENALDKAGKIGPNTWVIDDIYKCPDTGIMVEVKAGFVPETNNVSKYFNESGDKLYDPIEYKSNIFRYNGDYQGLHYSKHQVPISKGKFSIDRSAGVYGTIDILQGIKTTNTKNGIKRTQEVKVFEVGFLEWLREHKLLVRSRYTDLKIDENEMEETLLAHYKQSSELRKYLGIDGLVTTNQYDGLTSGTADIVACVIDSLEVEQVQEIKKEGGPDLWKGAFQGISYAQEKGIKDVVLIAQDEELPSDIQIKVDVWNNTGWNIRYEPYSYLTNTEVFPLDEETK